MAPPSGIESAASTTTLLYVHPSLKLLEIDQKGLGYVAQRTIKRGELLMEERPFVWDSGSDRGRPDLEGGVQWLLRTGAVQEMHCPNADCLTVRERAEMVAALNSFRNAEPCKDGHYPAMMLRASARFNHACYPNAGGYTPGGRSFASVVEYLPRPFCTYALEEIRRGEEACICYLGDADQLAPASSRQRVLEAWGFTCTCSRCKGSRPLDRRLEGIAENADITLDFDRQRALQNANKEYRALFDATAEGYNPPTDDFAACVQRLNDFREKNKFLDNAHCAIQRVRKELLAAYLLDFPDGPICQKFAGPAAALLLEDMHIQNAMLAALSPCKCHVYAKYLSLLKYIDPKEAVWLQREAKTDGVELWHVNSLWTHDPDQAQALGAPQARNLPPRAAPGPPPREGPAPRPGACCVPWLGEPPQRLSWNPATVPPFDREPPSPSERCRPQHRASWPRGGRAGRRPRRAAATMSADPPMRTGTTSSGLMLDPDSELPCAVADDDEEMPPLLGVEDDLGHGKKGPLMDLWEAYGDFGVPTVAARGVRGVRKPHAGEAVVSTVPQPGQQRRKDKNPSWFKFK